MIKKEKKQAIITEYARKEGDTGSCEVQIAIHQENKIHSFFNTIFIQINIHLKYTHSI